MRTRPIIVITTDVDSRDRRGVPDDYVWVKRCLVDAVLDAGGLPLLVTHLPDSQLDQLADLAQGMLLSGSIFDIPPEMYGAAHHELCGPLLPERSTFEVAMLTRMMELGRPVLGVCGGMQLINIALGGDLVQDLTLLPSEPLQHEQPGNHHHPSHQVQLAGQGLLADLVGTAELAVNSTHHQVIGDVAPGLRATAHAPDGVIEALEHSGGAPLLAVQWHPEYLYDTMPAHQRLFTWLVTRAEDA